MEDLFKDESAASPLPHRAVSLIKKRLLFHVVDGHLAGEVGFPPGGLVTAKYTK